MNYPEGKYSITLSLPITECVLSFLCDCGFFFVLAVISESDVMDVSASGTDRGRGSWLGKKKKKRLFAR